MSGYITFGLGGRALAAPLDQVREIVRAVGLEDLVGSRAPISGLLELRGEPLPVVDLRTAVNHEGRPGLLGDVLVLQPGPEGWLGVAVDKVDAVLPTDALVPAEVDQPYGLPGYVTRVLRAAASDSDAGEDRTPVIFEVDVWALAGVEQPAVGATR